MPSTCCGPEVPVERQATGSPFVIGHGLLPAGVFNRSASGMQPLSGLTVLDFSTLLPGPLATLILAEAGARVIKVERPGGEDMRQFPPFFAGGSAPYALLNRGKEVVFLDLKSEEGRARADDLCERRRHPGRAIQARRDGSSGARP